MRQPRDQAGPHRPGPSGVSIKADELFQVADVAVMFGDSEFCICEVPADTEFQDLVLEQESESWELVPNRIPPDPSNIDDVIRATTRQFSTTNLIVSTNMVMQEDLASLVAKFRKAGTIEMSAIAEPSSSATTATIELAPN